MNSCSAPLPIDPIELAMLQRIFDNACESRDLNKTGLDAENLAAMLVQLFEHGIRKEHQLSALVA